MNSEQYQGPRTRPRVARACERCRVKKAKCNGEKPCQRCNLDKTPCSYKVRRKAEPTNINQRYSALLQQQHDVMSAGVVELYKRLINGTAWDGPPVKEDEDGPSVHLILDRLGLLDRDEDAESSSSGSALNPEASPPSMATSAPAPAPSPATIAPTEKEKKKKPAQIRARAPLAHGISKPSTGVAPFSHVKPSSVQQFPDNTPQPTRGPSPPSGESRSSSLGLAEHTANHNHHGNGYSHGNDNGSGNVNGNANDNADFDDGNGNSNHWDPSTFEMFNSNPTGAMPYEDPRQDFPIQRTEPMRQPMIPAMTQPIGQPMMPAMTQPMTQPMGQRMGQPMVQPQGMMIPPQTLRTGGSGYYPPPRPPPNATYLPSQNGSDCSSNQTFYQWDPSFNEDPAFSGPGGGGPMLAPPVGPEYFAEIGFYA